MFTGLEIMAIAGLAQGVGGFLSGQDTANQYTDQAGQILESAKQGMRKTAKAQSRRLGSQKAGYAVAGVAQSGSAEVLSNEQIKQDELEILTQKYNAQLGIKQSFQQANQARMQGTMSLIKGVGKWD